MFEMACEDVALPMLRRRAVKPGGDQFVSFVGLVAHKLDATIQRAAIFRRVGRDRGEVADTVAGEPPFGDAVVRDERITDGFRAPLGKPHVVVKAGVIVGMTDHDDAKLGLVAHQGVKEMRVTRPVTLSVVSSASLSFCTGPVANTVGP